MLPYRKTGEHYNPEIIQEVVNRGYGNVIVWSGINDQKTPLVQFNGRICGETFVPLFSTTAFAMVSYYDATKDIMVQTMEDLQRILMVWY